MEEIQVIVLIITFVTTWVDYIRPLINKLDYKPFNCGFCLSIWISFAFCLMGFGFFVMSAPLFLRIIERRLL